jgi:hypothetical protein
VDYSPFSVDVDFSLGVRELPAPSRFSAAAASLTAAEPSSGFTSILRSCLAKSCSLLVTPETHNVCSYYHGKGAARYFGSIFLAVPNDFGNARGMAEYN